MHVLAFAPHPDDDLIGCGGSLIKHRRAGRAVTVVYMTSGNAGSRTITKADLAAVREREARAAMAHVGIDDLIFLGIDDGHLADDTVLRTRLTDIIRAKRPDIVYLPHALDGHPDHQATNKVVTGALGYAAGPWFQETTGDPWRVSTVLAYEVWTPLSTANYHEDITDVADDLKDALAHHTSQLKDLDYDALLFGLARYRGVQLGHGRLAEAFAVLSAPVSGFSAPGAAPVAAPDPGSRPA